MLQVGNLVKFTNPDNLEQSRDYERVVMRVERVLEGMGLAFCRLADNSLQTFGLHTLEPAT